MMHVSVQGLVQGLVHDAQIGDIQDWCMAHERIGARIRIHRYIVDHNSPQCVGVR